MIFSAPARAQDTTSVDSLAYYDDLFNELDNFLDSILAPRTMFLVNAGYTNTFLNFETSNEFELRSRRKNIYSPSLAYFHKNGLGIAAGANIVHVNDKVNPFQYQFTASYDYLKDLDFAAGLTFSRYVTKDYLPFYTSPLQNEASAYYVYRNWWMKPAARASYGWGTRKAYEEREDYITSLRLRPYGFTRVESSETISDFNLMVSVRHDFYWLNVLRKGNVFKLTPLVNFTSGTQKFGFNQVSNSYMGQRGNGSATPYDSENISLDSKLYFQPVSLAAIVKLDISFGRFYFQPQLAADIYFPARENKYSSSFMVNTGYVFSK